MDPTSLCEADWGDVAVAVRRFIRVHTIREAERMKVGSKHGSNVNLEALSIKSHRTKGLEMINVMALMCGRLW